MAQAAVQDGGSSPLVSLFGEEITSKEGAVATSSLSEVELIGIYFSAHWCPPCRSFTPRLIECYNNVNKDGKRFEIIFSSSDQEQSQYDEYYGEMPWLSVGFESPIDKKLSQKYKIQGIPTLVFVNPKTGETITKDGRDSVQADLEGNDFPWTPKTFWELMADAKVIGKTAEDEITGGALQAQLSGGYLGIYFSAHWCGPCRGFTPQLIEWYNGKKDSFDFPFEIMFASSDRSQDQFDGYYGEMPWRALSYSETKLKGALSSSFGVRGIPCLAIVDVDSGRTITTNGRMGVSSDPHGFPWKKKSYGILGPTMLDGIESTPYLLIFSQDDGSSQVSLLESAGRSVEEKAEATGEDFELILCTVPKEMELRGRLMELLQMTEDDDKPKMMVLDLGEGQVYFANENTSDVTVIDQTALDEFVRDYQSGNVQAQKLTPPPKK